MRIAALVALLVATTPANAGFFTYSEWSALSPNGRATYIAGVYDTLSTIAYDDSSGAYVLYVRACFSRSRMNNGQMADNLVEFVKTRPKFQAGDVVTAFVNYVIDACGPPPPKKTPS